MDAAEIDKRIREIVARFHDPRRPMGLMPAQQPMLDTSKPNLHDSKGEFLEEKRSVAAALENAEGLLNFLMARYQKDQPQHAVAKTVSEFIDESARATFVRKQFEVPVDVISSGAVDVGLSLSTIFILIELIAQIRHRKQSLIVQEAVYWNVKNRPPNHYARTIALRFAKLVAHVSGQKPTFGTSRDGGHPSTEFGRALEEIFSLLGISASVVHPARWAINQLTEEDYRSQPTTSGLLGSLFGQPVKRNTLADILDSLQKDGR